MPIGRRGPWRASATEQSGEEWDGALIEMVCLGAWKHVKALEKNVRGASGRCVGYSSE